MSRLIIHITKDRMGTIRAQGHGLLTCTTPEDRTPPPLRDNETEYHELATDESHCDRCGESFCSVDATSAVDLENIKVRLVEAVKLLDSCTVLNPVCPHIPSHDNCPAPLFIDALAHRWPS